MLMERDSLINKPTDYQIGILFCLWSYNKKSNKITFTSNDIYFLEQIKGLFVSEIETYVTANKKTRFKISTYPNKELLKIFNIDIDNIPTKLDYIPENIDLKEFFKAYLEINANFQVFKQICNGRKIREKIRKKLRAIGRECCLNLLNSYVEEQQLASKKTVTNITSKNVNCHSLAFTMKEEIINIYNFFYTSPCYEMYWKNLKENIETYFLK